MRRKNTIMFAGLASWITIFILLLSPMTAAAKTFCYYDWNFDVSGETTDPEGLEYNGTHFFVSGWSGNALYRYDSSGTYIDVVVNTTDEDDRPDDSAYNNGNYYVPGYNSDKVYKYNSAGDYTGWNFSVSGETTTAKGLEYNETHFWVVGYGNQGIFRYNSTGDYTGWFFNVSSETTEPEGVHKDGDVFYVADYDADSILKYNSTGDYMGWNKSVHSQHTSPTGVTYNGTHFWVTGTDIDNVTRYTHDTQPPTFSDQSKNSTIAPWGGGIELAAKGNDECAGVDVATLSTNLTGNWTNESTQNMSSPTTPTWSNFSYSVDEDCDKKVGWKIYYNDTVDHESVTGIDTYKQIPYVESSSNPAIINSVDKCSAKHNATFKAAQTGDTELVVKMPYFQRATFRECNYGANKIDRIKPVNLSEYCNTTLTTEVLLEDESFKLKEEKATTGEKPSNLPGAVAGGIVGTLILVYTIKKQRE